jgi:hypothetical protein
MATLQETKQAYEEWRLYREALRKSTTIDIAETFGEKQARIKRLEADDEAWNKYYFESYCTAELASFQKKSIKKVRNTPELFIDRCWARELSKTTITRMDVLNLILRKKKKNVLFVSNSEDNAKRLLEPYRAQLDTNQRIINDYGKQRGAKWKEGDFRTRHGVSFRAVGADQSPRGSNNDSIRPDVIIIDDIDTDQDCLNPEIIAKRVNWIFEALIPTRAINVPLLIICCGNIIAEYCCMTELNKKANVVEIVNIRTNGVSSWIQKNSEEQIDRALSLLPYSSAQKEYFNNPMTAGRIFKELKFDKIPSLKTMEQLVVYGDPSTSNSESKNSSFKVVALLGRKNNITYVIKVFCKQCGQEKFIQAYYDMYNIVNAAGATAGYYMECNRLQEGFYDSFYGSQFVKINREKGIALYVQKDDRVKVNKFTRIEATLEPPHRLGWLIFNQQEQGNEHMNETEGQFKAVSPTYKGAMDAPDCIEGGYKILDEKVRVKSNTYRTGTRSDRRY